MTTIKRTATLASMELRALATLLESIQEFDGGASESDHVSVNIEVAIVRIDQTGQHVRIGWDEGNWCLLGVLNPKHNGSEGDREDTTD